jgi:hypothetical protein
MLENSCRICLNEDERMLSSLLKTCEGRSYADLLSNTFCVEVILIFDLDLETDFGNFFRFLREIQCLIKYARSVSLL